MRPLGLYLHIPFCKAKCIYCDFYSLPHSEEKMDAYTAALQRDLMRWADQAKGHTVDTIYFGGGTPSYLGADRLCRILETVFAHYRVDKNAEITTEANPDSAREVSALRQFREAGFNRISLGMQSASDDELRLIGRVRYDALFTFIFSPRAGTPAAKMDDPTPKEEKNRRFDRLCDTQNRISLEIHQGYVGRTLRVLVDGREKEMLTARTEGGRLVRFAGDDSLIGQFLDVTITGCTTWSLVGEVK